MAENLTISTGNKVEIYHTLIPQIKNIIKDETDLIANLANITAAIHETFKHLWVGFYIVKESHNNSNTNKESLVLAPFQGPLACTRIHKGKGVCGIAWETGNIQIVPNVDLFPGHIACSSRSRSEIVVPIKNTANQVWAVLDIDSEHINTFDEIDALYLQQICELINKE